MKAIRRRSYIFAVFTGFLILTGVGLLVAGGSTSEVRGQILPASVIIGSVILAGFWIREIGKLKIARLISESPILHIHTAVISDLSGEAAQPEESESTEVIISYFGILLDARIIKFNQDGIRLSAVEIGADFISFTCGTEKRTQNIRLLRPAINPQTIAEISEKFRYETGITPTLLS